MSFSVHTHRPLSVTLFGVTLDRLTVGFLRPERSYGPDTDGPSLSLSVLRQRCRVGGGVRTRIARILFRHGPSGR